MNDRVFRALLDLFMCSDPWPASQEAEAVVREYLNEESARRGFAGWVVAYHEFACDVQGNTR